jgi:hypothetical protein
MAVRVMGNPTQIDSLVGEHSDFWPDKYPCPHCEKPTFAAREMDVDPKIYTSFTLTDVSPEEAFSALHGLGLPKELECGIDAVEAVLKEHPVRRIIGATVPGTSRCCIHQLELWDGTRLFFGAGAAGAVIYRMVRPRSFVEKLDGR